MLESPKFRRNINGNAFFELCWGLLVFMFTCCLSRSFTCTSSPLRFLSFLDLYSFTFNAVVGLC